jgi:glycosyltransferase involved in cell wall biosynthesis
VEFNQPSAPRRIAYLVPSLAVGGTERALVALLEGLPATDYDKHVICLSGFGPLENEARAAGATLHDLGYSRFRESGRVRWNNLLTVPRAFSRLVNLLRRERFSILHTMIPACNIWGAIAGRLAGTPRLTCSKLSLANYRDANRVVAWLEDRTDPWFHLVHCKSQGIVEDVARREPIPRGRMRVVYNGLQVEKYVGADGAAVRREWLIPADAPVVGVLANLNTYKGHADLVAAAPGILRRHPETRFVFVGRDDGIGPSLMEQAKSLGVAERVLLAGARSDVPQVLAAFTILVSASHEEGFSNVILEAMASGLPVVATRVGGNPEAVEHGRNGLIVAPRAPLELAAAVTQLLDAPGESVQMGELGRERANTRFSHEAMTRGMRAFYDELMTL